MAITSTNETAIKLGGVTQILLTPWTGTGDSAQKGSTTYSLDNIVADTTAITQEEATTNTVDCETRDEPIFENINLGSYTFAAESGDIQETILVNCFGFRKDAVSGNLYAPTVYKELWAEIEVVFGENGSLVCPKVKMSGNIDASSLKTGMVRGVINGTCYSTVITGASVTGEEGEIMSPFYFKAPAGE